MNNHVGHYPSFLKNEPIIWGMRLSDLFFLSAVLFFMVLIGANELATFSLLFTVFLIMAASRKFFPRRHFEFALITKNEITRRNLNEKLRL